MLIVCNRRHCQMKRVFTMPFIPEVTKMANVVSGFSMRDCDRVVWRQQFHSRSFKWWDTWCNACKTYVISFKAMQWMIQQQTFWRREFLGSGNNQACLFDTWLTASLGYFTLGSINHLFQSCDTDLCDTLRNIKAVPTFKQRPKGAKVHLDGMWWTTIKDWYLTSREWEWARLP